MVAIGAGGLTLATSLGGTEYPWDSPVIIGLFAGSALVLGAFVIVERRAAEPVLPIRLFSDRVFTVCTVLSFVVGFAMLGALTFLPTYLQYVRGVSPTISGVQMLPMVLGLLVTSVASGQVVGRTGRYKLFPLAGSVVMALGLFMLSRLDAGTPRWIVWSAMLVLGAGIGLCMQVLVIIVQNTAEYRDLGVATSGVTFFRTLGSSFGAVVFGSIYANNLATNLAALRTDQGVVPRAVQTPGALHSLPTPLATPIVNAYAETIQSVFLYAIPIAIAAFVLALFLKEVPLRDFARASAPDLGEGFGMLDVESSDGELERAIAQVVRRDGAAAAPGILADSVTGLEPADAWCVAQVHLRRQYAGDVDLPAVGRACRIPAVVLRPAFEGAAARGLVRLDDDGLALTDRGEDAFRTLSETWRRWLVTKLPERHGHVTSHEELDRALHHLSERLADNLIDEERKPAQVR